MTLFFQFKCRLFISGETGVILNERAPEPAFFAACHSTCAVVFQPCYTRREYSSLATAFAQQRSTCYGRDGTSRSINQENNIEALVIFKKIQFALGAPNRYESYNGAKKK